MTAAAGEVVDGVAGTTTATRATEAWAGPAVAESVGVGLMRAVLTLADGGSGGSRIGDPTMAGRGAGGSGRKGEWIVGPPSAVLSSSPT